MPPALPRRRLSLLCSGGEGSYWLNTQQSVHKHPEQWAHRKLPLTSENEPETKGEISNTDPVLMRKVQGSVPHGFLHEFGVLRDYCIRVGLA